MTYTLLLCAGEVILGLFSALTLILLLTLCAGEVILGRSMEELAALMASLGQPAYRAKQLRDGVMQARGPGSSVWVWVAGSGAAVRL